MVLYRCTIIEYVVLPVCSFAQRSRVGKFWGCSIVGSCFIHQSRILRSIQHIAFFPCALPAKREVIVDFYFAFSTFLGCYQYYTVGCTCTINCCRSCILQYFDRSNISGVDIINTTTDRHTVDDIERVGIINGTCTTYANYRTGTGLTVLGGYLYTGSQTFQSVVYTYRRSLCEFIGTNSGNGSRYYALLLYAVTNDYHFIQCFRIFLKYNF